MPRRGEDPEVAGELQVKVFDDPQACTMVHTPAAERTWNSYCAVPLQLTVAVQCTVAPGDWGLATSEVNVGVPQPLSVKGRSK